MSLLVHLYRRVRNRIGGYLRSLEDRRLRRVGLSRKQYERQYPRRPGTLDGLDPDHMYRYKWARPFCEGKRVLDYGCGVGYGAYLLSDVAEHVRGYDVSADALAWADYYARDRTNIEFSTRLPDKSFDCITCFECIEHVADPESVLDWLAERTGEYLFISTPEAREGKWSPFHIREFTREELLSLLGKRFETIHVEEQLTNGCRVILARCSLPRPAPQPEGKARQAECERQ